MSIIKLQKNLLICVLTVFCFACDESPDNQVRNDFQAANPNFESVSAIKGEGNSHTGYYHIKYKKPDDNYTYEQIWVYQRQPDGTLEVIQKEREKVVKR